MTKLEKFTYAGLDCQRILRSIVMTRPGEPNKVVGTAKGVRRIWLLRVPGHQFTVTPDMPSAKIWPVGGQISVKAFPSWQAAVKATAEIVLK